MTEEFKRCAHCRERIELINFALGPEWRHWPTPYGNYTTREKYRYCHGQAAEPEAETMADRWKATADSADALLRAVMDTLGIRPDQDAVIEARRISAALAEQGTEEWEYGYELIESDTRDVLTRSGAYDNEAAARHWAHVRRQDESDPEYPPLDILIVRRRKAGPWVPVEHPNRPNGSES